MSERYVPYMVKVTFNSFFDAEYVAQQPTQETWRVLVTPFSAQGRDVYLCIHLKSKRAKYRHWKKVCKAIAQVYINEGYKAQVQY